MRRIVAAIVFMFVLAASWTPLAAQTSRPTFLFLLEGKGVPTGTIHVFSVNSSTGGLTEALGSPYHAGLIPRQFVVDPTGRYIYIINWQSFDITAYSIDASTGALTELPGSPFFIGSQPEAMGVDPTGRFLYVSAITGINGAPQNSLYEYTIDSPTGVLTPTASSPQALYATSFSFSPAGNYAYLSQGSPSPGTYNQILTCSIEFSSGGLTPIGGGQPASGGANVSAISPSGGSLYSIDSVTSQLDAFTVYSGGAYLSENVGSPYAVPNNPYSLAVHPSGNYLYVVNENYTYQTSETPSQYVGSISTFAVNSGTGALTQVTGSPFAAGINSLSIVVDPTGRFAYTASTIYTFGYTGFAQIAGYSINASSGVLTPFPGGPWTDSANSSGDQLVISSGPSTASNPVPMISSLSPPSTIAAGAGFTLQVNGSNFVPGSTVYFGGQVRSTTFVSSAQLNASIPASDIDNGGTAVVFVFSPLPGGGASMSVEFPVSNPTPIISSIDPSSANAAGPSFALFVIGSNFVTSSVVNINGTPLATAYSSPTVITAEISTANIVAQGTASITVTSPSNGVPGGGTSNAATLTILPPVAPLAVSSISPTSATAGGPAFTLTVNGSGFVQGSTISFNVNNVSTTFVNSTQLTALIPAGAIAIAGNPYVIVTNPNGFTSTALTFTVNNPAPGGGTVTPPSLPAGSAALILNVTGTGFTQDSMVLVNGSSRVTTYVSSTLLRATLLPRDLAQGGTLIITVMNPPPGGGTTAAISFIVADYLVIPPSSAIPVTAGQTANFALTVAPSNGAFYSPVTFSTSMLPAGATPVFSPLATITPGASPQVVTLSIATTAHTTGSVPYFPRNDRPVLPQGRGTFAFALAAGLVLLASGRRLRRLAPQLLLALLLVAAVGLVACGAVGSGTPSSTQVNPATGTPAGTYPIIVTATSGRVSHSATVTLTVM